VTIFAGRTRYDSEVEKSTILSSTESGMPPRLSTYLVGMMSLIIWLLAATDACAQAWPSRPIRIVTGAPGSTAEFAARMIAQGLSASLGQPVIVDPRATGGATIFADVVARAQPDGYTLMIIGSTLWIGPLFRKAPYDAIRDFAPISLLAESPNILVVTPGLPVNSVRDLIELAKAKPGSLNYSTSGIG